MAFGASPVITVSIVTYHTALDTLRGTVEALRKSTVPLQLILVDNTPGDHYFSSLSEFSDAVLVKSPRNGGYSYGHNIALKRAASDARYHLILNPDVIVHDGCLENLLEILETRLDVGLVMPQILNKDGSIQYLNKENPTVLDLALRRFAPPFIQKIPFIARRMDWFVRKSHGYDQPGDILYASGCFMLYRRLVLEALGGFDERYFMYFEDADLTRRTRAVSRVLFVPSARITHFWARGSYHNWKLLLCTLTSAYRYFRKWGVAWC